MSYWFPKDGKGVVSNDCLAVFRSSRNPVLAHTFLNYMLDFDVAMKNFSWNCYQPPQKEATVDLFSDPNFKYSWMLFPNLRNCLTTPSDIEHGYPLLELDPEVDQLWQDNWEEFTSGV